ncbi:hypothetical protein BKA62DRAFT_770735 [Auriculariales sp. MPI-PUGE-AT-0066]|nr:hypothetical protein BKA62DRAFT_770735 [Auriculariales sp. MPI-PUGE-AT-0066]
MHLIISGATGQVGAGLLRACLASPRVTRVSILSRRIFEVPSGPGLDVSKARVIVHTDYLNYPPAVLEQLKDATGAIWALGISQSKVSKEEYVVITHDYPMAAATAFANLNDKPFKFVHVSGEGADQNGRGYAYFSNIKGRTEVELMALPQSSESELASLRIYNDLLRSAFSITHAPEASHTSLFIHTDQLGEVMVDLALSDGEPLPKGPGIENDGRLMRNSAVRAWKVKAD